jgi:5-methyltetrahydrofolate--homocysteine methyltransferase
MTHEEILQGLYDDTLVGNAPSVKELTEIGLAKGMDPEVLLYQALIPSLEEVRARSTSCARCWPRRGRSRSAPS